MKNPLRKAYSRQRVNAKLRGIEWQFTFEQWLEFWQSSGHLHKRGRGRRQFVMARYGDVGPYAPGNVRIVTAPANHKEMNAIRKRAKAAAEAHRAQFDGLWRRCAFPTHPGRRLQPPPDLTAPERAAFRSIVAVCEPNHFCASDLPVLCVFTRAILQERAASAGSPGASPSMEN